jgi:tetratricopeptide (TPR) repeat protein
MLVQAALVVATIWAFYEFRYSAFHEPRTGEEHFYCAWSELLADTGVLGRAVEFARENRLLPEAYLYGTVFVGHHAQERPAFLNGRYSVTGWRCFFPYAFLVKMPLPTFLFLIFACAGAVWSWRQARSHQGCAVRRCAWRAFYATAPLWILLTFYWAAAINSKLNIGQRHVLPTYAAMFILVGATAHWFGQRSRLAGECCATYPHYLAYFNWIAGGSRNGYKHLVDSSLDWGQDLPGLRRWLTERDLGGPGKTPAFLAYFGTSSPSYYQVPASELGGGRVTSLTPLTAGVYCISATSLQRIYQPAPGQWCASYENVYQELLEMERTLETADPATRSQLPRSKGEALWREMLPLYDDLRLGRLCALLRQREPDANVGYSILIYRLSAKDVRKALLGPPIMEVIEPDHQALRLNPDHPAPHIGLGIALARLGKADEAIKHYQQALRLNPKSPEAHNDLGVTLADLGKTQEAIEHYQQALLAEPDYVDAHYNLGLSLASMRRLSEAMDQYNQVLRRKPDYAAAHRNLALLMAATGRNDEAVEQFRHVVRLEPDEAAAHSNLGNALAAVGKTDQAIQQFREALLLKPDFAEVHNNLGFILAGLGRSGEALEQYRQALRLEPGYVKAHNNLANVLASVGKIDEAIVHYNKALRLMPDSKAALNNLAWLLATREGAQGVDPARAVELAERAHELSGQENAQCLDTLAAAYAAAGRFSDAVITAQRAAELAESTGQGPLAKAIRARLEVYRAGEPYREGSRSVEQRQP